MSEMKYNNITKEGLIVLLRQNEHIIELKVNQIADNCKKITALENKLNQHTCNKTEWCSAWIELDGTTPNSEVEYYKEIAIKAVDKQELLENKLSSILSLRLNFEKINVVVDMLVEDFLKRLKELDL